MDSTCQVSVTSAFIQGNTNKHTLTRILCFSLMAYLSELTPDWTKFPKKKNFGG